MKRSTVALAATSVAVMCLMSASAFAQGSLEDYQRAARLGELTRNKVVKARIVPHWFDDGDRLWYRNDLAGGTSEYVLVEAAAGKREPAFDHSLLAEKLAAKTGRDVRSSRLPLADLEFLEQATVLRFRAFEKNWRCRRDTCELVEDAAPPSKPAPAAAASNDQQPRRGRGFRGDGSRGRSPDGQWTALVKDDNVFLLAAEGEREIQLTREGTKADGYRGEFYWSPDSKRLVALRTKAAPERQVHLIESAPKDQLQPKLHTMGYNKPGDPLPARKPHLFDVAEGRELPVSDALFENPWSIDRFRWEADSSRFTFLYNQRGHQALRYVGIDAAAGVATALIDETSKTFVNYSGKFFAQRVDGTDEMIWMSERDGWNHLYLYDFRRGELKHQITSGQWPVLAVDRVDAEHRQIWFQAGGIHEGQDPYFVHHCRINFDGTGLVKLTAGDGTHTVEYSPDRRFLIDTYSRVNLPPVTELRRSEDGTLLCELERADASALQAGGWQTPEPFVAKGRDGETDIYGVIYRPTNFDAQKKYPVVEAIYAGPQDSFVPKRFSSLHPAQSMAELGFVVVQIDGMGTSDRSKAFHDVCFQNLGDAGFPDRKLWIKAAAATRPFMDLTRVGIYGGSAGGQNALGGLLFHPEFYKVGVAVCGCHDNRMDKVWWNEQWMGFPLGPHYEQSSNVVNAKKLQGKLLLIVGELDRNVDPASTMQVVDALIKADKDFDLLVIPGGGHGLSGAYGARRQKDFLVRHLLNVEPRWASGE